MKKLFQLSSILLLLIFSCSKDEPVPPTKYTVSISAGTGGNVSSTGGSYEAGTTISVTATPNSEYVFSGWSNGSTDNPLSITVNSNTSISASFTKKKYALNISVEGQGTVSEEIVSTGKDYDSGTTVKLTAVSSEGWMFYNWTGDVDSTDTSIELTVTTEKSVTANFVEVSLTTSMVGEGEITAEIVELSESNIATVKLTANAPNGWRFGSWSGAVSSTEAEIQVTVEEATEIIATFIQIYDLTVTTVGEGEVTEEIVTETSKTYDTGTKVKLTAVPAEGWRFDSWSGAVSSTNLVVELDMTEAKEIIATFIQLYDLTVNTVGEGTVTEELVTTTGKTTSYDTGVTVKLTAEPVEGWRFDSWSGAVSSTETVIELEMTQTKEVTATFIQIFDLDVTVVGEGTVEEEIVIETGKSYDIGTNVKLTAKPAEGWRFTGWSGAITGTDSTTTVSINEKKEIVATFIQIFELTINIVGEGTVTEEVVTTTSKSYDIGATVKLTATPAEGYVFESWDGSLTGNANPTTFNIDGSKTITATFIENPIYLDENGITIKAYSNSSVGETGFINGLEYKIVDESTLRTMIENGDDITRIVTSKIENMYELFYNKPLFNQDISTWDVSNATSMSGMFNNAVSFNQDISVWDVSKVTGMAAMFKNAKKFNQDISNWNVGNVTWFFSMFENAESFNQPIGNWNTSKVVSIQQMFKNAISFNQDLNNWNLNKVGTDPNNEQFWMGTMKEVFYGAKAFNGNISDWDVSNVTDMYGMFSFSAFNKDISKWNVSKVKSMALMFYMTPFDKDISNWDMRSVTLTSSMFRESPFNQNISGWNVSNVIDMHSMFKDNTKFNQNIGEWNVSKVNYMPEIFQNATSFNQDLSNWCVALISSEPTNFAKSSGLDSSNYPIWGTCPPNVNDVTLIKFSESKSCINNVCDVTLGLILKNNSLETISVNKIEKWVNESLDTTYTTGDVFGDYASGSSKSFNMTFNSATSGKIVVFWTYGTSEFTTTYNWTN